MQLTTIKILLGQLIEMFAPGERGVCAIWNVTAAVATKAGNVCGVVRGERAGRRQQAYICIAEDTLSLQRG